MKFGEAYNEYLHKEEERLFDKCSHVEYKRLKKVLKTCQGCKSLKESNENAEHQVSIEQLCQCQSCPG